MKRTRWKAGLLLLILGLNGSPARGSDESLKTPSGPKAPPAPNPSSGAAQWRPIRHGQGHILLGVTSSVGNAERFGPEIGVGRLSCGSEGLCGELDALAGATGPGSYFVGLGMNLIFFPAISRLELGIRSNGHGMSGYHVLFGLGTIVMPYISVVRLKEQLQTKIEAGVTAKWMTCSW